MFFTGYEHLTEPLAPRAVFLRRLGNNLLVALVLIGVSLVIGMLGYHLIEELSWLDAYAHAAMILSGMGPYGEPKFPGGKFFEGTYALYSGLVVVATAGLILAPALHRLLHGLHVPDEDDEKEDEKGKAGKGKSGGP